MPKILLIDEVDESVDVFFGDEFYGNSVFLYI